MIVSIIAGGWSASQLDLKRVPGTVIAVNDAARYAPRWDIGVSMDRLWTEHRWPLIVKAGKPFWLRRSTLINVDARDHAHLHPFENDHKSTTLAEGPGRLNGTHSGFCALNLAYQMRPSELYLIGFDMARGPKGERHWYPPYEWSKDSTGAGRLAEWSTQFEGASRQLRAAGIEVYLCGSSSSVRSFRSIDRQQLEGVACVA